MFLDTSVIIKLFINESTSKRFQTIFEHIENEAAFISMVQVAELADWCCANDVDPARALAMVRDIVELVPVDEPILLAAARLKHEMRKSGATKFSLIDGLILASARALNEPLLTFDADFRMAEDVVVLD